MIEARHLSKHFRIYKKAPGLLGSLRSFVHREYTMTPAVDDFSFQVERGEFVGLLGPNGAGKTTLMKMMTGIIVPTKGELKVLDFTPSERRKNFRQKIALVMGQKSQLWWDIPAMDSLLLLQKYYEISDADFNQRVNELGEILDVRHVLQVHVRKLSLGERMKLELMASLLHEPEVIFLDEPTIGLDLVAQKNIRDFLLDYQKRRKVTIILTSHYMADVEALCSRIVLILGGRKRFDGAISSFEEILGKEKFVTFRFSHSVDPQLLVWRPFHPVWNSDFTQVDLRIPEHELRALGAQILKEQPVTEFNTEKMPIERVMQTLLSNPTLLDRSSNGVDHTL